MLVTRDNYDQVLKELSLCQMFALDTETTGLDIHRGDKLFAIIIRTYNNVYYFNFKQYELSLSSDEVLGDFHLVMLQQIFDNENATWFIHNAKFDMAALGNESLEIKGRVHCTAAIHRVIRNDLMNYELETLAKVVGMKKSKEVDQYIKDYGLVTVEWIEGKKLERKHFDKVPFEIMHQYACMDVSICWTLGLYQLKELERLDQEKPQGLPSILGVYYNECEVTKVCYQMERLGALVDIPYSKKALEAERINASNTEKEFYRLTDITFCDSAKVFVEAFTKLGLKYGTTEKGNPSFKEDILEKIDHPIAQVILDYRAANKKASTHYANFIYYADKWGRIHANLKQFGTNTGRISCAAPNFQNLNKEEDVEEELLVRRAFVPTPGFLYAMIDYDQMEYRLLLESCKEMNVIDKILYDKLDVHEATARMMGVTRDRAKTLNFMLLYGGGIIKLAKMLKISSDEAARVKRKYFDSLPNVCSYTRRIIEKAGLQGKVRNWFGRVCHCRDKNFAYTLVDHLIQGGCADVVKIAMVRLFKFLEPYKSRMVLQVHDEILFEIHESEISIIPKLQEIMSSVFPYSKLPLTCSVSHSRKSWADKVKGLPT